jgi:hypothetical protein
LLSSSSESNLTCEKRSRDWLLVPRPIKLLSEQASWTKGKQTRLCYSSLGSIITTIIFFKKKCKAVAATKVPHRHIAQRPPSSKRSTNQTPSRSQARTTPPSRFRRLLRSRGNRARFSGEAGRIQAPSPPTDKTSAPFGLRERDGGRVQEGGGAERAGRAGAPQAAAQPQMRQLQRNRKPFPPTLHSVRRTVGARF